MTASFSTTGRASSELQSAGAASPSPLADLPAVDFLGLPLVRATTKQFQAWVVKHALARERPVRISYLNSANVNLAFDDAEAARHFRAMDCLYADGQAVVWASRRLGEPVPERINAGDFIGEFFAACAEAGLRVACIGGYPGDADAFARHYADETGGLMIVYTRDGFFRSEDRPRIAAEIRHADPDVVLVGMGAPRQEEFVLELSGAPDAHPASGSRKAPGPADRPRVWWCVGALFEYGPWRRRRAPVWMRRAGLEWLFRLALEPRRLARRYLIGNPKFAARVLSKKRVSN